MQTTIDDPIWAFEQDMEALVRSVQQYAPNQTFASSLIRDSDEIGKQIKDYEDRLQQHASADISLKKHDNRLTGALTDSLKTLVECKRSLDTLPKLHDYTKTTEATATATEAKLDPEDTRTVLSYALKLSKFSKIPRTFDGALLPNNFTWPGDDNMRRGNLAIASLMPNKLIQYENYGPGYVPPAEQMEVDQEPKDAGQQGVAGQDKKEDADDEEDEDDEDDFIPERTNSIENVNKGESTAVMAGLDLLDFDDE